MADTNFAFCRQKKLRGAQKRVLPDLFADRLGNLAKARLPFFYD